MAGKPDGGLKDALQLDKAADDLHQARAAAAENDAAEQVELFPGSSVFGRVLAPNGGGELRRSGPGRPRGSRNRRTQELADYAARLGGNPILKLIEIVATPIDVIAATLGCKKVEAADYWRKCAADLAPYIEQKLPTAVQLQGANAGMLVINMGGPVGEQAIGLDLRVLAQNFAEADRLIEHEENQTLSDDDDVTPHDAAPHE
jgi:hypothetical protein